MVTFVALVAPARAEAADRVEFANPADLTLGGEPDGVAVGEFNGDADPDLAVSNYEGSNVSIFLGAAGATFTGPATIPLPGAGPETVVVGEFNGDTDPDLVTPNSIAGNVSILLGSTGGTFTGPTNFGAASLPTYVGVGNFDAGIDPDLAVVNQFSDNISILLGSTGGTFTGPTNFTVANEPTGIAVADFNGDLDPDLATHSNDGPAPAVSVILGGAGGTFGAPASLPLTLGAGAGDIAAADFNGDADPDLAVANFFLDRISVLGGSTGGSFSGQINFTTDVGPGGLIASNLDGDADSDIVTTNSSRHNVSILLGTGGGSFNGPSNFATGLFPNAVAAGDFNGDSDSDLAVATTDGVSILLQTALPTGPAGPAGASGPAGPRGPPGRDATVTCKAKGKKRIKCSVAFTASASSKRASARLTSDGVTYARGSSFVDEGRSRLPLVAVRRIPAGRYTLTVKVRYGNGKTAVTKRKVTVG